MSKINSQYDEQGLKQRMERIPHLLAEIEHAGNSQMARATQEVVQTLMDFHQEGLSRIMESVAKSGRPGEVMLSSFGEDQFLGSMLLLHDLHPMGVTERVEKALKQVRPKLAAHQGDVKLCEVRDQVVYLQLLGSCESCPSSIETLKHIVEEAVLDWAPEINQVCLRERENGR